jgi:hypothetical protein
MWLLYTATYVMEIKNYLYHLWGATCGAPLVRSLEARASRPSRPRGPQAQGRATLRSPHASQSPQLKC